MSNIRLLLTMLFTLAPIFAIEAFAQSASPDSLTKSWTGEPGMWSLLKVLLLLALVLGLIWISLSALRKVTGKGGGRVKGVEIVGGLPLGQRRSLVFVKIGGKIHIIGATEQHLSSIGLVEDPAEVAELISGGMAGNIPQFKDFLGRLTRPGRANNPRGGGSEG